jgi:small membrane protein
MIAQIGLSILLAGIMLYAWMQYPRAPAIGCTGLFIAAAGLYFVWRPEHASWLASRAGIGRGVDLILYVWVVISLLVMLNLHLKLRSQMELITALARELAIANARFPATTK